jgi:hypothetical protein
MLDCRLSRSVFFAPHADQTAPQLSGAGKAANFVSWFDLNQGRILLIAHPGDGFATPGVERAALRNRVGIRHRPADGLQAPPFPSSLAQTGDRLQQGPRVRVHGIMENGVYICLLNHYINRSIYMHRLHRLEQHGLPIFVLVR